MKNIKYNPEESIKYYDQLKEYAEDRTKSLSSMLAEYISVTDEYGKLFCRITSLFGTISPKNESEATARDLLADIFDFTYETRPFLLKGKPEIAFPLARRAYESLSLLVACHFEPKIALKWETGKQIGNKEIRKILDKHPMGETEESTRELYRYFSKASHPNRDLVAKRFLGEGNNFVLGSIAIPDLILTADLCIHILSLWFWFAAFVGYTYISILDSFDKEFGRDYIAIANKAKMLSKELVENYNHLLKEFKNGK